MLEIVVMTFIVYVAYYVVSIMRYDKYGHVKKKKKSKSKPNIVDDYVALPAEVKYFIKKYNLDLDKINLRGIMKLVAIVLGVSISLSMLIVFLIFDNELIVLLVTFFLMFPIFFLGLKILGNYFLKKGYGKNV